MIRQVGVAPARNALGSTIMYEHQDCSFEQSFFMRKTAEELTDMTKVVFTKTIKETDWENTEIRDDHPIEVVRRMKQDSGSDILVLGSGSIVRQLAGEGLIDEYIFIVTPVAAGEGKPPFSFVTPQEQHLMSAQTFEFGNVILHYAIKK